WSIINYFTPDIRASDGKLFQSWSEFATAYQPSYYSTMATGYSTADGIGGCCGMTWYSIVSGRNSAPEGSYPLMAFAAMSHVKPYTWNGHTGQDAWNWIRGTL